MFAQDDARICGEMCRVYAASASESRSRIRRPSRTLRTWGDSESGLAERLADHMRELDAAGPGGPTLAFLASGIEGLKVRITVKADDEATAAQLIEAEDKIVRDLVGDIVFGVDDETMEHAVAARLIARGSERWAYTPRGYGQKTGGRKAAPEPETA